MRPGPPNKAFPHKPFSHYHPKKNRPFKQQPKYRPEPDRVQKSEIPQIDIVPNAIEYILARNFLEDGVPHSDFNLLESLNENNLPSYVLGYDPVSGVLDHKLDVYELKNKLPTCMNWTPNGKRVLVGNSKGKISVIHGSNFAEEKELIIQQTKALKAMGITKKNKFMLVGDEEGVIKYLDSNYKELMEVRASEGQDGIREISIAPSDQKFLTCSDKEKTLRIWDLEKGAVEKKFVHGNEINCCQWHPYLGLIASGSKDSTIKFWDPNSGEELASLINHTNSVNCIKWNNNGNWLLSCARDQSIRLYDLRMVKEIQAFTGIDSEVEVVSWNPFHERLFTSGTKDGTISFWLTMESAPVSEMKLAHFTERREMESHYKKPVMQKGGKIVELSWNPIGDLLASCGNDKAVKFWGRPKEDPNTFKQVESQMQEEFDQKDVMDGSGMMIENTYDQYNQYQQY